MIPSKRYPLTGGAVAFLLAGRYEIETNAQGQQLYEMYNDPKWLHVE
tara:strand:+ start:468 stop:608 length:141 start_codon:yes stop_codon:yes gene_type:complete